MIRLILAITAASLLWLIAGHSGAQPHPPQGLKAQRLPVGWPREVKGYGKTIDDARRDAVQQAVKEIARCLRSQDPPLTAWQPDEDYVRAHLLLGQGVKGDDEKIAAGLVGKVWIQPLVPTPDFGKMILFNQEAQRHEVSAERQTMVGYGLAVLSLLLATGWGYLRIDEWTGGRFSRWLGIGAVTLLGLAGLGWWLSA